MCWLSAISASTRRTLRHDYVQVVMQAGHGGVGVKEKGQVVDQALARALLGANTNQ